MSCPFYKLKIIGLKARSLSPVVKISRVHTVSAWILNIHSVEFHSVQFSSVTQSCLTLCDPMNLSTPGLPVHHHKGGVICISEVIDIFPAILISACASSSPAFLMMYSAYKLNKQGDNIQPWCTPFPIWNQSVVPCPVLTVASWPAYRFLKRQVRWSGIPISFRIFHSLLWSTQSKAVVYLNLH